MTLVESILDSLEHLAIRDVDKILSKSQDIVNDDAKKKMSASLISRLIKEYPQLDKIIRTIEINGATYIVDNQTFNQEIELKIGNVSLSHGVDGRESGDPPFTKYKIGNGKWTLLSEISDVSLSKIYESFNFDNDVSRALFSQFFESLLDTAYDYVADCC